MSGVFHYYKLCLYVISLNALSLCHCRVTPCVIAVLQIMSFLCYFRPMFFTGLWLLKIFYLVHQMQPCNKIGGSSVGTVLAPVRVLLQTMFHSVGFTPRQQYKYSMQLKIIIILLIQLVIHLFEVSDADIHIYFQNYKLYINRKSIIIS